MRKSKKEEFENLNKNEEILNDTDNVSSKKEEFEKLISEKYQEEFKEKILEILNDESQDSNDDEKTNDSEKDILKRIELLEEKLKQVHLLMYNQS